MIDIATIIFGSILIFVGYIIPKSILILIYSEEDAKKQESKEKENIIKNLQEIKLASDIEKQNYIIENKLNKNIGPVVIILLVSAFLYGFAFIFAGFILNIETMAFLVLGICLITIGIFIFYINKIKNQKMIQKFMNSDIYVADCYAYDRKTEKIRESNSGHSTIKIIYLVKVTDGNYFIQKWFPINYNHFYDNTINVKLYISNEMDIYNIIIDSKSLNNL